MDPVFDAKVHNIISLSKLLKCDQESVAQLKQEFRTRGWSIIRLSPMRDLPRLNPFFVHSAKSHGELLPNKETISRVAAFFEQVPQSKIGTKGYSFVDHKESIHVITPNYNDAKEGSPQSTIQDLVSNWTAILDSVSVDLLEVLAEPIFGCKKATLADRADLPIAFGQHKGMFDIAYYLNKQTVEMSPEVGYSTEDVNCVPHFDPGLLSISFLSTHEGLQLQDPNTGAWFAGPVNTRPGQEDLGVIWLGEAAARATKGNLRAGVHRVVYPNKKAPRTTAWYEMCTVEQINQEVRQILPKEGTITLPNLPNSRPLRLNGEPRLIERHYGIPMSKVMRREDAFAAAYSEDRRREKGMDGFGLK